MRAHGVANQALARGARKTNGRRRTDLTGQQRSVILSATNAVLTPFIMGSPPLAE
jgi:hypothetical protein